MADLDSLVQTVSLVERAGLAAATSPRAMPPRAAGRAGRAAWVTAGVALAAAAVAGVALLTGPPKVAPPPGEGPAPSVRAVPPVVARAAPTPSVPEAWGAASVRPRRSAVARVVAAQGRPEVRLPGARAWVPCGPSQEVAPGSQLRTGEADRLELELRDGSRVRLEFDAVAALAAEERGRLRLALDQGQMWLLVAPQERGLEVRTAAATATALGTLFTVEVGAEPAPRGAKGPAPEPTMQVGVVRGRVRVSNRHGWVEATERTLAVASAGQVPEPPRSLGQLALLRLQAPWGQTFFEYWVEDPLRTEEAVARLAPPAAAETEDLLAEGNQALAAGRVAKAEACYRSLVRQDPGLAAAWNNLGLALQVRGEVREALGCHRRAVRAEPGSARYHSNLARCYAQVGNLARARQELAQVVALEPADRQARYDLGRMLAFLGDWEGVEREAQELMAVAAGQAQGMHLRGEARRLQGDLAGSERWYLDAAQADPGDARPPTSLAAVCFFQGRMEEAERWARRALEVDPESLRALNRLGLILIRQGRFAEAQEALRRAAAWHLESGIVMNNLGLAYLKEGALAKAIQAYRQAVAREPDSALCHTGLAVALERGGRLTEAKREYQTACRLDPTYREAYERLAGLHQRLGETRLARAVLEQAERFAL